ncbi:hypothetical protein PANT_19d00100 [Moesziomyces antarcticus T-34]|uniref:Uncharacterized protein n=1 Tax=Pseudozyma antarctica (strain T-34) TaxID=1151754 RepID=M9LRY9_PSEA3|nr:hypothetical protein PANT_19d00100 [Moesziomyces antarcticus T-34]
MDSSVQSPNAAGNGTTRLPGLAGTQSEKQLTQRELAALKTIKRNVDTTKYGGWMLGAAGTFVLLGRRKPPPRLLSKLGWSVVGGLGGSFLTMPIGIMMSRGALKDVEDPQHLRMVLAGAIEEQRQGRKPQVSVAPPKDLDGETDAQQEWGGERAAQPEAASFDSTGNLKTQGGSDSFDSFSSSQPSSSTRNVRGNAGMPAAGPSNDTESPPGTGAGTRWAQLRGERSVEPSKWERIRQDNARTAYSRSGSAQAEPSDTSSQGAQFSSPNSAPPSRPSRPAPRSRDEPVMTLSGDQDDPRWSSPASFSPQSSGWGGGEFLDDPAGGDKDATQRSRANGRRGYGILSINEERAPSSGVEIESDAPIQVVKGSLLTALGGGLFGSAYGVLKGRQGAGTILGTRMAMSSFAFAFPFFAVREYVVSPVLNRTSSGPDPANRSMRLRTVAPNRHTHNLLASGLAGAVVGAGAAAFTRGPRAIHKGVATFGLACTALQLVGNETRIVRDALLRPSPRPVPVAASPSSPDAAVSASQAVAPMADVQPTPSASEMQEAKPQKSASWLSKVKNAMPIRSVTDEEYEEKLNKRLTSVNQRMADVETEIREIEALLQQKEAGFQPTS